MHVLKNFPTSFQDFPQLSRLALNIKSGLYRSDFVALGGLSTLRILDVECPPGCCPGELFQGLATLTELVQLKLDIACYEEQPTEVMHVMYWVTLLHTPCLLHGTLGQRLRLQGQSPTGTDGNWGLATSNVTSRSQGMKMYCPS